jgi:tetratricopeptide (TPR) repeat protein
MTSLRNLPGALVFHSRSLRALAAGRSVVSGAIGFAAGFLVFIRVRDSSGAAVAQSPYVRVPPGVLESFLDLHLLQMLLFVFMVYVPVLIVLSNAFAGDGLGWSVSRVEYADHLSALLPVWGMLFLTGAPLLPVFFLAGGLEISAGELWLGLSMAAYTAWGVRVLNYLSWLATLGVCLLSMAALPVLYLLTNFLIALPFFILVPLLYVFVLRFQELMAMRSSLRGVRENLRRLTLNPRDADAHYQLGLLHFRNGHPEAAQGYFQEALAIDPEEAEYHYFSGRILEAKGKWTEALEAYEATYRLSPEFGQGDIFREVGKGYLHAGQLSKACEFLRYFLDRRPSDPEGRYWLAVALGKTDDVEGMRAQLRLVLEQARSSPRFFRRENREWIYRSRRLLHGRQK